MWMTMRRMRFLAGVKRGDVNLELIECCRGHLRDLAFFTGRGGLDGELVEVEHAGGKRRRTRRRGGLGLCNDIAAADHEDANDHEVIDAHVVLPSRERDGP